MKDDLSHQIREPLPPLPGMLSACSTETLLGKITWAVSRSALFAKHEKRESVKHSIWSKQHILGHSYSPTRFDRGEALPFGCTNPSSRLFLIVDAEVDAPRTAADTGSARTGRETVLLAKDKDSLRKLTRSSLEMGRYKVLEARDGIEAIQVGRSYDGVIDLLLTDIVRPGIGGRALAMN